MDSFPTHRDGGRNARKLDRSRNLTFGRVDLEKKMALLLGLELLRYDRRSIEAPV